MLKQTSICLIASLVSTIGIFVIGLLIALVFSFSGSVHTAGIGAVTGGVSNNVFLMFVAALPVIVVVLFLLFRKLFQKRGQAK